MNPKDVLEMSWTNLTLYSASIPSYNTGKEKKSDAINGDDPKNKGAIQKLIQEAK